MSRRIAVLGTDTGVGKTVVTAALAALALAAGRPVRVLKPVQTGAGEDDDAREVDRLVGPAISRTGWRLDAPLAPVVAARLEGVRLEPSAVVAWIAANAADGSGAEDPPGEAPPGAIATAAAANPPLTLIETAGGCAVEIAEGFDMAALARRCWASGVLVCRPGLGTLNHTVLSVEHLRRAGVDVLGLVINGFPADPGQSELTNPAEMERLTGLRVLGALPRASLEAETLGALARSALAPGLGGAFDRTAFLAGLAGASPGQHQR